MAELTRADRACVAAYVAALLICWSPFKPLAYLCPFLFALIVLAGTRRMSVLRNLAFAAILATGLIVFHSVVQQEFLMQNAILAAITYGGLWVLAAIPSSVFSGPALLGRMLAITRFCVAAEGVVGLGQAVYGFTQTGSFDIANGDYIEGTIHIGVNPSASLGNPMFAVSMALMLLFVLPRTRSRRVVAPAVLGGLALLLASVMHVLYYLTAACALAALLVRPAWLRTRRSMAVAATAVLVSWLGYYVLESNVASTSVMVDGIVHAKFPRIKLLTRVWENLPGDYPWMPLVGLGPGQFSSRAALIGTGEYFGGTRGTQTEIPLLERRVSPATGMYVYDLWLMSRADRYYSSATQPFSSWVSLYTEFGGLATLGILFSAAWTVSRVLRMRRQPGAEMLRWSFIAGTLFLGLLAGHENYLEVPQAIFPGLCLLKAAYARLCAADRWSAAWVSTPARAGVRAGVWMERIPRG